MEGDKALQALDTYGYIELVRGTEMVKFRRDGHIKIKERDIFLEHKALRHFITILFQEGYRLRPYREVPRLDIINYGLKMTMIGRGSFGTVQQYGTYAIKTMHFDNERDGIHPNTLRETTALVNLNDINIVPLVDVAKHKQTSCKLVFPIALGSLERFSVFKQIKHMKPSLPLSKADVPSIIYQLIRGLAVIHMNNIWHRDIKPNNILVFRIDDKYVIKYADFGSCRIGVCEESTLNYTLDGHTIDVTTLHYRSPESLLGAATTDKSDVWSLGVIIAGLALGRHCLQCQDTEEKQLVCIFQHMGNVNAWSEAKTLPYWEPNYEILEHCTNPLEEISDPQLRDLCSNMLQLNPKHRVSAVQLLDHPYFLATNKLDYFWAIQPTPKTCREILQSKQVIKQTKIPKDIYCEVSLWIYQRFNCLPLEIYFHGQMLYNQYTGKFPLVDHRLTASVCHMIASKLHQTNCLKPRTCRELTANLFTLDQLVNKEREITEGLSYQLFYPTCYDFYLVHRQDYAKEYWPTAEYLLLLTDMAIMEYMPETLAKQCLDMAVGVRDLEPTCLDTLARLETICKINTLI